MRRSSLPRATKPMRKIGRKGKNWIKVRRELSADFAARGITSCEVNLSPDCRRNSFLSFAHSMKRRFITTDEQLRECCLSCIPCHQILDERMGHEAMLEFVQNVIAGRE